MKMLLIFTLLILNNSFAFAEKMSTEKEKSRQTLTFSPPKGWRQADPGKLTPNILAMVVGKGSHEFPPSINLAIHQESGSLKEFLRFVKKVNQADGIQWKDLGPLRTQAGEASLSQLDAKTEWGTIREMQVIYIHENNAYILTAASLKDEFPKFYKEFFASLRSLKIEDLHP